MINNDIFNLFSLSFLGMLLTPIPCLDVLGKFDSDTQIKMLDNSLSDNKINKDQAPKHNLLN